MDFQSALVRSSLRLAEVNLSKTGKVDRAARLQALEDVVALDPMQEAKYKKELVPLRAWADRQRKAEEANELKVRRAQDANQNRPLTPAEAETLRSGMVRGLEQHTAKGYMTKDCQ